MRSVVVIAALLGCTEPEPVIEPEPCTTPVGPATLVDTTAWGPLTGFEATLTMPTVNAGDLLIIAVGSPAGGFGKPVVVGGQTMLQVGLQDSCGHFVTVFSVGNIAGDMSQFKVAMTGDGTKLFSVFMSRFAGLPADIGAHLTYDYAHSTNAAAPRVAACPGAAVMSAAVGCGALELAPASPFTGVDVINGMTAAAYVPDVAGAYGAEWIANDHAATTTVVFQ